MTLVAHHSEYDIYDGYRHYKPIVFKMDQSKISAEVTRLIELIQDRWSVDISSKRCEILKFIIENDKPEIELLSKIDMAKLTRQTSSPTKYLESIRICIEDD